MYYIYLSLGQLLYVMNSTTHEFQISVGIIWKTEDTENSQVSCNKGAFPVEYIFEALHESSTPLGHNPSPPGRFLHHCSHIYNLLYQQQSISSHHKICMDQQMEMMSSKVFHKCKYNVHSHHLEHGFTKYVE